MTTTVYSGSLQSKKKAELREIAIALKVSDMGTKEDLQQRIRKFLDDNRTKLEENPAFSGLFHKRKRTVPHSAHIHSAASPVSESTEEISAEKKIATPSPIRLTRRSRPIESTPLPEAQEVSMMLRKVPVSPPENETEIPGEPPASTPKKERSVFLTSTPRSILRNIPRPTLELADTTFKALQTGAQQHARVYLQASRSTLSDSLNISIVTILFELLFILYQITPWSYQKIHFPRTIYAGNLQLAIPYPPLVTFQSSAFWSVLLHWSIPTLVIPAILGSIISFHPAHTARVRRVYALDPLTASICRLAAQYGYPYKALNATVEGIDVIGPEWRVLNAAICVAFAFSEAICVAKRVR